MNEKVLITHMAPDLDAITSIWLLKRYAGFKENPVIFVNTGKLPEEVVKGAAAVVDTGGVWEPDSFRFDHHQLPGDEANSTCAAKQVAAHIAQARAFEGLLSHLNPLLDLVYAVDTGKRTPDAVESLRVGIHAILRGHQKRHGMTDAAMLEFGMEMLDNIASSLRYKSLAEKLLHSHTEWLSGDGKVWALSDAPEEVSESAFEKGASLVLFTKTYTISPTEKSCAVGLWRNPELSEPNCGEIVQTVLDSEWASPLVKEEMSIWFKHPAGFFSGRGTLKSPNPRPIEVTLPSLAKAINSAWNRE